MTGGTGQVKFTMMIDATGGATLNASTGLYKARPHAGTSTVEVADGASNTAGPTVTVNPAHHECTHIRECYSWKYIPV